MNKSTVQDLLGDFNLSPPQDPISLKVRLPLTIWLPADLKIRYDKLQEKSGKRFGKKIREIFMELITEAEQRIS